jgi:hypothetical protein
MISIFLLFAISCDNPSETDEPSSNEHFNFVLYNGLVESEVSKIKVNLNNNRQRILDDLRITNMPEVIIKIWGDYASFLNDMETDIGTRYNGATGYIFSPTEVRMFFNSSAAQTAVHEFAHLVSMQINITIPNNPRWLWEAVAIYEAQEFVNPNTLSYMVSGNYPTINQLNSDFNSNRTIYRVGYILSEFIISQWGVDLFIELIRSNGNIPNTLGVSVSNFESEWYRYIEEVYLTND